MFRPKISNLIQFEKNLTHFINTINNNEESAQILFDLYMGNSVCNVYIKLLQIEDTDLSKKAKIEILKKISEMTWGPDDLNKFPLLNTCSLPKILGLSSFLNSRGITELNVGNMSLLGLNQQQLEVFFVGFQAITFPDLLLDTQDYFEPHTDFYLHPDDCRELFSLLSNMNQSGVKRISLFTKYLRNVDDEQWKELITGLKKLNVPNLEVFNLCENQLHQISPNRLTELISIFSHVKNLKIIISGNEFRRFNPTLKSAFYTALQNNNIVSLHIGGNFTWPEKEWKIFSEELKLSGICQLQLENQATNLPCDIKEKIIVTLHHKSLINAFTNGSLHQGLIYSMWTKPEYTKNKSLDLSLLPKDLKEEVLSPPRSPLQF